MVHLHVDVPLDTDFRTMEYLAKVPCFKIVILSKVISILLFYLYFLHLNALLLTMIIQNLSCNYFELKT